VLSILANGKINRDVVRVNKYGQMEVYMKENGLMTRLAGMAN